MDSLKNPSSLSSRVTTETIGRAVDALLKWIKSKAKHEKSQLLEHDEFLYLIITLKKIPPQARTNPHKIPLPHPFHPFDSSEEFCLIFDDRSKSSLSSDSAKKKIQSDNIPISKVLKLSKLKSDYRPFEAKRKLCSSYDLFFADKRIIPLLPRLLGKEFFKKKKIPIPVNLIHKNWKEQIQQICGSALLYLRTGTCCVVKIGRVSQGRDEIVENMVAAINGVAEIVPKKWGNIRSLHLKSNESLALPVYHTVPDMGLKIEGVKMQDEVLKEEGGVESARVDDIVEEKEKEKKSEKKRKVSKKGRIHEVRYMDSNFNELLGDVLSDDEKSENGELGDVDLTGKKRKIVEKPNGGRVVSEVNGEKQLKKSGKAKKGAVVKQKKVSLSSERKGGEEVDGETLKKKKSKIEKTENGQLKMKIKKSNRI